MKGGEKFMLKITLFVLAFIAADIITGIIGAFYVGNYDSAKMRRGLFNKLGEILAILFGEFCDYVLPQMGIDFTIIGSAICVYIALMEITSIIENIGILSPSMQEFLSGIFARFNNK